MALTIAPPKRDLPRVSPRRFERDNVWRLCGWGSSALLAVGALFIATQADGVFVRSEEVRAPAPKPAVVAQAPAVTPEKTEKPEKDAQTVRLQAEVLALAEERLQLTNRVARLERQLVEVTGSIRPQAAPQVPEPPAVAKASPPPTVAPVASAPPEKPVAAVPTSTIPVIDPLAMPAATGSVGGWTDTPSVEEEEPPPPQVTVVPQLEMREVRPAPLPLAALSAPDEPKIAAPKMQARSEYGIDLGGAKNMDALRERWVGIKANLGPLLTGLQPIAVRDRRPGSAELRLVVGPMPSLQAARQVCTRFAAAHVTCQASKFDSNAVVQQ